MKFHILEQEPHIVREYLNYLTQAGHELIDDPNTDLGQIDGIIIRSQIHVDTTLLDQYPNLRYVCRVWVGLDKVDMQACKNRNITVLNTPWANANAVADLVLWAMLTLSRNVESINHDWHRRYYYEGNELDSQVIGIVWFGNIWRRVYQRLRGFGTTQFVIYDPYVDVNMIASYEWCSLVTDIADVVRQSDIITMHLPLSDDTKYIINQSLFTEAKPTLKLINTSRWWIINESDLYDFLKLNPQASAMMDVWEVEPDFNEIITKLQQLPNFVLTPHIGAMTYQATKMMHYFKEIA